MSLFFCLRKTITATKTTTKSMVVDDDDPLQQKLPPEFNHPIISSAAGARARGRARTHTHTITRTHTRRHVSCATSAAVGRSSVTNCRLLEGGKIKSGTERLHPPQSPSHPARRNWASDGRADQTPAGKNVTTAAAAAFPYRLEVRWRCCFPHPSVLSSVAQRMEALSCSGKGRD